VDNSQTIRADVEKLQASVREFAYEIYDGDQLFILAYDEKAEIIQEWTDNAKKVETALANGANAIVSGGYDIPDDQADIRTVLASTLVGNANSRPEIQLLAVGTPDGLTRSIDIAALSSWLAVRAIDRETRRLDAIERGEPPPPPQPTPAAIPQQPAEPAAEAPNANSPALPPADVLLPRRAPAKPKIVAPRPPIVPPIATAPAVVPPAPLASQPQVAPLPPPIEVRPPPGTVKPKPRPPLSLTPQVANPPPRPAMQN